MYCLTQFLWVSNSRMAYMRWFWPQVPYEVMVKVLGHSLGCGQEDSVVIQHRGLSTGLLFMAWQLTSLRMTNQRLR